MLHVIDDLNDPLIHLVESDPVRPHILLQDRLHNQNRILVLENHTQTPTSVVCVAFSSSPRKPVVSLDQQISAA